MQTFNKCQAILLPLLDSLLDALWCDHSWFCLGESVTHWAEPGQHHTLVGNHFDGKKLPV